MMGLTSNLAAVMNDLGRVPAAVEKQVVAAVALDLYDEDLLRIARMQLEQRTTEEQKHLVEPMMALVKLTPLQRGFLAAMSAPKPGAGRGGLIDDELEDDDNALLYQAVYDWVEEMKTTKKAQDVDGSGRRDPRAITRRVMAILKGRTDIFMNSTNPEGLKKFLADRGVLGMVGGGLEDEGSGVPDESGIVTELLQAVLEAWHDHCLAAATRETLLGLDAVVRRFARN